MKEINIIQPDDWHVHFRDDEIMKAVVPETARHFARAIVMPNLVPPILNGYQAANYKSRIKKTIPKEDNFTPFMTLYLTENTDKKRSQKARLLETQLRCNETGFQNYSTWLFP